ncbi:MAG: cation transporter [Ignavibacteriales bacterium]|nr:cation transporter [Ignavibacteriales bacterium]
MNLSKTQTGQFFAIRVSFAAGIIMLFLKWFAFSLTGSVAIFSDAAESVVHIVGVAFAVFSLWLSIQPADKNHLYGHEKINFFSAGFEGLLIVLAAAYIIYLSVSRLINGVVLANLDKGTWLILGASILNLFLGLYLVRKGKKAQSIILIANGKHVLTDSWTSFGVVAGLCLTLLTGWLPFDPIVAILAACNILWTGSKLIKDSVGGLMDSDDPEIGLAINTVLEAQKAKTGYTYHKLRYRKSGNSIWVEFHLLLPKKISLETAHDIATKLELLIKAAFDSNSIVTITTHLEPAEN